MKSPKYDLVKFYYETGKWNEKMVENAVGRWITAEECAEILGKDVSEISPPAAETVESRLKKQEEYSAENRNMITAIVSGDTGPEVQNYGY